VPAPARGPVVVQLEDAVDELELLAPEVAVLTLATGDRKARRKKLSFA